MTSTVPVFTKFVQGQVNNEGVKQDHETIELILKGLIKMTFDPDVKALIIAEFNDRIRSKLETEANSTLFLDQKSKGNDNDINQGDSKLLITKLFVASRRNWTNSSSVKCCNEREPRSGTRLPKSCEGRQEIQHRKRHRPMDRQTNGWTDEQSLFKKGCKDAFGKKTRPSRPIRCDVWTVERMRYPTDQPTDIASYNYKQRCFVAPKKVT